MSPVNVFGDYDALLTYAEEEFKNETFLSRGTERISFAQFAWQVRSFSKRLMAGYIYVLSIQDPIKYLYAYYACVLAGSIACLSCPDVLNDYPSNKIAVLHEWDVPIRVTSNPAICRLKGQPDKLCTIAFSSGTTAGKKGVMLSQKNLLMDTAYGIDKYRFWRGERILHILPYHHLFGLVSDLLAPLHAGAEVHFPDHALKSISEVLTYKPNAISLPPAFLSALISLPGFDRIGAGNGGSLRKILCAGAALPKQKTYDVMELGILPCTAYGLTECSPCVTITEDGDVRPGTVGREIGCVSLSFTEEGEILVSGDTVMLGYYKDPLATTRKIIDGWLHTGDIGYRDEYGHIVISGRLDDLLVLPNGKKCPPRLIEEEIALIEGVKECVILQKYASVEDIEIVIVRDQNRFVDFKTMRGILRRYGIVNYSVHCTDKTLPRNLLGKVIRKNVLR